MKSGSADVSHRACWGWSGMKTVSRPEPNSTPERAMDSCREKVRLVFPAIRGQGDSPLLAPPTSGAAVWTPVTSADDKTPPKK